MSAKFVHLHVHTEYSLLDGAGRIKTMVSRAKEQGYEALAITDHGTMYGTIAFYKEAKKQGIKPIIGCEVYLAPGKRQERREVDGQKYYHLILLAENQTGYRNLVQLVSEASLSGFYYKPRIDKELLRKYHEGLICLSACIAGEIPRAILKGDLVLAEKILGEYLEIFGRDNLFLEIQNHNLPQEQQVNTGLVDLGRKFSLGLVATNDVHYVNREDRDFHDIELCIGTGKTVHDLNRLKFSGDDYYLKSPEEMAELFKDFPEALENTVKIAERTQVDFEFGHLKLPYYPLPKNYRSAGEYLRTLCEEALESHYEEVTEEVSSRLDYELSIIGQMGYDGYFLIVWDFLRYARGQGIPVGPGRGSAAGSMVAYLLDITALDPLKYSLLFERFLNPERVSMPDIDIDFCYWRREEVIDYVKRRYGTSHVAQIITFGTMGAKGAIRDVARAMDIPYKEADALAKLIPNEPDITIDRAMERSPEFRGCVSKSEEIRRLIDMARRLEGLPRHASTHAAGVVIAPNPLTDYVPVQMNQGALITQFDKDYIEELGLLKMDFLGLRTLTVMDDTIKSVARNYGRQMELANIPLTDEKTAQMLSAGETGAVFQMESAGMTNLVKEIRPQGFVDLIPTVALYRPGPLGSGMVEDFIAGRQGRKKVTYMHPSLEPILKETFGVILYQEQVMEIVQVMAGFTLGQADILRRAMGKKKHDVLMGEKEHFLTGCEKNGVSLSLANVMFDLLTHFADYGFNKSHSAAYALLAWQTAYLKAHYPADFMAAMLTSTMDAGRTAFYIDLCRRMDIEILPPDINESLAVFVAQNGAIRFGLGALRGLGLSAGEAIVRERKENGRFTSLLDFCTRVRTCSRRVVESFIKCGAFRAFGRRSQLLAVLGETFSLAEAARRDREKGQLGLFEDEEIAQVSEKQMPDIPEAEEILEWEKEILGVFISGHPLDAYKEKMSYFRSIAEVEEGAATRVLVRVAGIIVEVRRIVTKKGDDMCYVNLEDFSREVQIVVFPRAFYEYVSFIKEGAVVAVEGRVSRDDDQIKILADKFTPLEDYVPEYYLTVRDDNPEIFSGLEAVFKDYGGSSPVFLKKPHSPWQRLPVSISESLETRKELEGLLGEQGVRLA